MQNFSFTPGQEWRDTDGNLIQAHAGYMFYENETFFWYGENKEKSVSEREIWHWGVRLYSSKDLYNWTSEGIILPPELEDKDNPMYYNSRMDRPHIIYNELTKKYVMWVKIMQSFSNKDNYACIAISDSIKGPFKIVNKKYFPNGFQFGDFDFVKTGSSAYIIYNKPHTEMIISKLSQDYLTVEKEENYRSFFKNGHPPFIREAPAIFFKDKQMYMITSGTTGKFPNQSELATCDGFDKDWVVLGDPYIDDKKHTSFDSQISCIFKHPKKENLFIVMADRWLIDLPNNLPNIFEVYDKMFNSNYMNINFDEAQWTARNTMNARYVWLPILFENGKPTIKWFDSWRVEDFE